MKILVTGNKGFVGKNLKVELENKGHQVLGYDVDTPREKLGAYCAECEFVYHLAGVNRPNNITEYMDGNCGLLQELLAALRTANNHCPVMLSSSIQAALENPYGLSKRAGETLLQEYGNETGAPIYIYRFANLFGKWCRPNYNSVVATFCHNVARGIPIQISNPEAGLCLTYIDDAVSGLLGLLEGRYYTGADGFGAVEVNHQVLLGKVAETIQSFSECRQNLDIPDMTEGGLEKKLYSTYLSYLPEMEFSYLPKMNEDERGSFTELFKTMERGQVSVNIARTGIEKGNHWHHTKTEKFVVVSGDGLVKFRRLDSEEVISYQVSGKKIEIVDIPVGYTHSIVNVGDTDLVTVMWCNECYNPEKPDTYYLKVDEGIKP